MLVIEPVTYLRVSPDVLIVCGLHAMSVWKPEISHLLLYWHFSRSAQLLAELSASAPVPATDRGVTLVSTHMGVVRVTDFYSVFAQEWNLLASTKPRTTAS